MNIINGKKVIHVYSGLNGYCCCGCKGKHTYASSAKGRGKELRGYAIDDADINDRTVSRVVNQITASGEVQQDSDDHVFAVVGKRIYIAYFEKEAA